MLTLNLTSDLEIHAPAPRTMCRSQRGKVLCPLMKECRLSQALPLAVSLSPSAVSPCGAVV